MNPGPGSPSPQDLEWMGQPQAVFAALEGMVTIDEQMRIVMINPAAQRMFGRTAEQAIGLPLGALMPERVRQAHEVHVQRFIASDLVERSMGQASTLVGLRASGEEFPLEAAICKVTMPTDNGVRHFCTALLVDRSKEQALSHKIEVLNHQMRAIFERAPVAVWITDGDRIAFANQACAKLFGVASAQALVGRALHELLSIGPGESSADWIDRAHGGEDEVIVLGSQIYRSDGTRRDVEIAVAALPDHGKRYIQMVILDTTARAHERRTLLDSRRALREYSANIVNAREEERQGIARELHDELGQRLTALKLELSALGSGHGSRSRVTPERLQHMIDMLDDTVASTRRIAMGLRPPMLDDLGLAAAIEWLVDDFQRHHPIQVTLQLEPLPDPLPPPLAIALYRIAQEALTNIQRHAGAQQVRIEITLHGRWLQLLVEDDGQGFPRGGPTPQRGSFGLIGMLERVRMLGGQLQMENGAAGGARLLVRLPMKDDASAQPSLFQDLDAPPPDERPGPLTPREVPEP